MVGDVTSAFTETMLMPGGRYQGSFALEVAAVGS